MEPQIEFATDLGEFGQRIHGPGADRARIANYKKRLVAGVKVGPDLCTQIAEINAHSVVDRNPPHRVCAQAGDVGSFLNPGVRLLRSVRAQPRAIHALRSNIAPALCLARREKADHVGHVAAADEKASAIGWIVEHLRDPANALRLDLARHRRQQPRSAIGVRRCRQQFAQYTDRRGRRGDISPEARVYVKTGMIEKQASRAVQQLPRAGALSWQRTTGIQRFTYGRRRFARSYRPLRKRVKKIGDAVHQLMPGDAKVVRR